jgi:predicted RNA polymerase sigma factor
VAQALYLMFSEGYHGSHPDQVVREELCAEALRLSRLLADHPVTGTPAIFALLALMCFLGARLAGRRDASGALLPLEEQDRSRWDQALVAAAWEALSRSAAAISSPSSTCRRPSPPSTPPPPICRHRLARHRGPLRSACSSSDPPRSWR